MPGMTLIAHGRKPVNRKRHFNNHEGYEKHEVLIFFVFFVICLN